MLRIFKRIPWVDVLIVILVSALLIGGIATITKVAKEDKKTISSTVFKRGALDSNGLYVESDTSIYTKDLIECVGLEIEPDFEVSGDYQVFYYDTNKSFLGATELMDSQTDGVYMKGEDYPLAVYCRIVISPEAPEDEDGFVDEDWKIRFYNVASYADDYTIKVSKKQVVDYSKVDLLEGLIIHEGKSNPYNMDYIADHRIHENHLCTDEVSVVGHDQLKLVIPAGGGMTIVFYDSDGKNLDTTTQYGLSAVNSETDMEKIIDILPGTEFIAINFNVSSVPVSDYHLYFVK